MATVATAFKTYNAVGNREDLDDVISIVAQKDAPMWKDFSKGKASATYVEWQTDTLASATENAQVEGADNTYSLASATTRLGAYTQIFKKSFQVSGTQIEANSAGRDNEFDYQKGKRLQEIMRDFEYALVNGTGNSGGSGTARKIKGVLSWITTNVTTGTGTGAEYLTETMYLDNLQAIYEQGGEADKTYANGFQQRKILAFSTSNSRTTEITDGNLSNYVLSYESQFGRMIIVPDRAMTASIVANLSTDMWEIAELRPLRYKETMVDADAQSGIWLSEWALKSRNQLSSGKITGLKTS